MQIKRLSDFLPSIDKDKCCIVLNPNSFPGGEYIIGTPISLNQRTNILTALNDCVVSCNAYNPAQDINIINSDILRIK